MTATSNLILDAKILLGTAFIVSISVINTKIAILPVSNFSFLLTSAILWFISLCATLFCLHKLLQKKEPLQLFLKFGKTSNTKIKPNVDNVKALSEDIDKYFISKWYSNISHDEEFPKQSKILLEELITRLAEVQISVSNKLLLHGSLNLFLRHLKEFRRSLKRREKYGGKIEELYRYSHMCSNGSKKAKDYLLLQLTTNLLRHFINSELWNSLPCSVLVSILSRKFTHYLLNLASHPDVLNYILLNSIASEAVKEKFELDKYARISITQYCDVIDSLAKEHVEIEENIKNEKSKKLEISSCIKTVKGESKLNDIKTDDVKIENKFLKNIDETLVDLNKDTIPSVDTTDKKSGSNEKNQDHIVSDSPELTVPIQRRLSTDPVKIYEPKITKSNKTWRDSKDLGLGISLGQDPLDALPVTLESVKTFGKGTFWDTGKIEHFVEDSSAHILSEMKHTTQTTMEGIKSSMKPLSDATVSTLHNIKDLQETTVNNALNKIGDFQDEAASMVEGIFDLGKAGFRKGLRLTGLQDNIENAKASLNVGSIQSKSNPKKKSLKATKAESTEKSVVAEECLDTIWMNPLTMDSPNFDGQILLEKSNEKIRKNEEKEERELQIPFISMEEADTGIISPDPEYEDAADLASSIAKLRSLLQQRSSESSMSTPALSPMPPDDFDQKAIETESVSDLEEMDGFMPSFYKFCAKTATGVFDKTIHTIKTALPGTAQGVEQNDNAWIFVQSSQDESDILTRMKKLLTERKEYCTVDAEIDTAYEAIDNLELFQQTPRFPTNVEFEDELDDFEVKLPITKSMVDIFCELLSDTDTFFIQEPIVKAILLGLGEPIEKYIISTVDTAMNHFSEHLITIPEKSNQNTLNLDLEVYVEAILSCFPDVLKFTLGKKTLIKAFTLLISSLQVQRINEDVVLQIFELISMKLIEESNQLSPPASA